MQYVLCVCMCVCVCVCMCVCVCVCVCVSWGGGGYGRLSSRILQLGGSDRFSLEMVWKYPTNDKDIGIPKASPMSNRANY